MLLFASACVREMARRLDEVERNLRQSPTPNVELDLRRQIDELRTSEGELTRRLDDLTARNRQLEDELDRTRRELESTSKELSELRQRRRDDGGEVTESIERQRLDNAPVHEKPLRQTAQVERTQLTTDLSTYFVLTTHDEPAGALRVI